MMYHTVYDKQAIKDIKNLKSTRLDIKAKRLIEIVRSNPSANPPPYEALIGNLAGLYSRRITIKHRFVYQVFPGKITVDDNEYDGTVKIIRMWTHYDDIS